MASQCQIFFTASDKDGQADLYIDEKLAWLTGELDRPASPTVLVHSAGNEDFVVKRNVTHVPAT